MKTTRTERAAFLGIHRVTHRIAEREGRLALIGDTERVYARRRCAWCEQARNIRGSGKLCDVCFADGYRWCVVKHHVVPVADYQESHSACGVCQRHENKRYCGTLPPDGYIKLSIVAARLHFHTETLIKAIKRGWMAGHVWQRVAGGTWYIEDRERYELW
jgi:hypothetical protein